MNNIKGRVYKFGDNIDTDIMAPGLTISFGLGDATERENVKRHAFEAIRKDFYKDVVPGSILVAGKNFGFGSHREQANTVIISLGFSLVVADSIARLYQRNSIAIGFPSLEVPGITEIVEEGEELELDFENWTITNTCTGKSLPVEPLTESIQEIIRDGGIIRHMKKKAEGGKL